MAETIVRSFTRPGDAVRAVQQLESLGVPHDDISLIANNAEKWHSDKGIHHDRLYRDHDKDRDGRDDRAEGAAKGATTGGILGAGAGLLAGLGMLAIPGLGPVVAAGWLASTATGAAVGAAAGGAVGGLGAALADAGVDKNDAGVYAESVRRGGALVVVRNPGSRRAEIEQALNASMGSDATTRRSYYQSTGWKDYDPSAPAYTESEIEADRARYNTYRPVP